MHALVTGGNGFVGRHLVAALREAGSRVTLLQGDIRDPRRARGFRGDAVFHLAAKSHPGQSRLSPDETFEINTLGTARLLEALEGFGGRVLIVSSAEIYRLVGRPIRETDPLDPRNPYAWSKVMAEAVARAQDRLDVVIARPFNHTGPGQKESFVCGSFARQVVTGPVVRVGQLDSVRDFLDVRDVVAAYRLLIERGRRGETYNIASGRGWRIGDLLDTLIRLSGRSVRVVQDPRRLRPADVQVGDATRLRRATGWRPRHDLRATLADMIDAVKSEL